MRIMILAVNFIKTPYPVYPLGATSVVEAARRAGHDVILADLLSRSDYSSYNHNDVEDLVDQFKPDAVGLSLRNIESFEPDGHSRDWSFGLIRQVVADLRSRFKGPIFLGGSGFSLMPVVVLAESGADYGVLGEAEEVIPDFLAELGKGLSPGIFRSDRRALKQLVTYDPELVLSYARQGGFIGLQTKRGCPFQCVYCSYPYLEGTEIRPRPILDVLKDLRFMADIMGVVRVAFADAVFNDPLGYWRELLQAVVKSGLQLSWTAFFQPSGFEDSDWDLMKASGVAGLEFGTDGASQKTLVGLRKPFDFEGVRKIQKDCSANGIPAAHYIVFGGPGETWSTVEEGLLNLESLNDCVAFINTGLTIYPGTPLYRQILGDSGSDDGTGTIEYFSPEINHRDLDLRLHRAFDGRRDRIFPPGRSSEKALTLRAMGFEGLLWDTLIGKGQRFGRMR